MATIEQASSTTYSKFTKSTIPVQSEPLYGNPNDSKWKVWGCFFYRLSSSFLLHPKGPFRNGWDCVVAIFLLYTSFEIPVSIAFGQAMWAKYFDLLIDIFLLTDIVLNFHTAHFDKYDNLQLVTDKKLIAKRYLTGRFMIDFVTCIPFEFLIPQSDDNGANHPLSVIKILRIFRLLRLFKILRFFKSVKFFKHVMAREVAVFFKLFKITFLLLLSAHIAACLWWYVGIKTEPSWIDEQEIHIDLRNNENGFQNYSFAWYWAIVTIFTTGYGDIHATNSTEQWVTTLCILIGTGFHAYFISTLTGLINKGDTIKGFEYKKLEKAQSFCERKKLPKYLSHAILTHIRYHCDHNYLFEETEILDILPENLQRDVQSYAAKQFLMQLDIFQNQYIKLPEFIIGLIAMKCKSISCHQGFQLFGIGDIANTFYVQRTGKSTMYKPNEDPIDLKRGSVVGEYSSILFKKRKSKIQCKTWCEFYSIGILDIKEILNLYYPKSSQSKWKRVQAYLKSSYQSKIKHSVSINKIQTNKETELHRQYTNSNETERRAVITNEDEFKESATPILSAVKNTIMGKRRGSAARNDIIIALGEKYTPKSTMVDQFVDSETKHSEKGIEMTSVNMQPQQQPQQTSNVNDQDSECSFSSIVTDLREYQRQTTDTIPNNEDDEIEKEELVLPVLEELNLNDNHMQTAEIVYDKASVAGAVIDRTAETVET